MRGALAPSTESPWSKPNMVAARGFVRAIDVDVIAPQPQPGSRSSSAASKRNKSTDRNNITVVRQLVVHKTVFVLVLPISQVWMLNQTFGWFYSSSHATAATPSSWLKRHLPGITHRNTAFSACSKYLHRDREVGEAGCIRTLGSVFPHNARVFAAVALGRKRCS
jgi:hypothetical protein